MLRKIFITGLAATIPIVITVYVIVGLFRFADGILGKVINEYLYQYLGYRLPGLGIIISILLIFLVGLILKLSRMKISKIFENLFFKIPLVNNIYFPVKKIVDLLFLQQPSRFRGVVLVEYPREGIYSIGFITNESPEQFSTKIEKKLYNIFIPSSPFPTTGFTVIVPEENIVFLDMTIDEAVRVIVSGGMLSPYEKIHR
jgi:uncharacterized membrane protein